jgi:hypothetical protein
MAVAPADFGDFGNGMNNQPANTLSCTAGPHDEAHGIYGRVDHQ